MTGTVSVSKPRESGPPARPDYPLRLRGELDPEASRWLWLLKWMLVLPHVVVLALLWIAAFFVTVCAGFAILATGRYPRGMFDFSVGVLRWTWRVSFYATGAFGTDRYPPFSLRSDPSYPADLEVAYPKQLSRGLVLVKWWLLAVPQYLIVTVLSGGWGDWHAGLIPLLVIIAAVIRLFTGAYPHQLFKLVMGLNRWVYRVAAYGLLMTDCYPPFRLDVEPDEGAAWTSSPNQG
jgi:hypothetical protein